MKLNNLSRLTALLLALTMILSSVAFAAPVADTEWDSTSYQTMLSAVAEDCLCVTYYASVLPLDKMNGHTCVYEFLSTLGTTDQYQFLADLDNGQYQYLVDEETNTYSSYSVSDFLGAYYAHIDGTNGTKLDPLMCTCTDNLNGTYFNYEPGNGEHNEGCPWTEATETSTIIKPDIPQPPVYGGDPQGNQYTSTQTIDLVTWGDRAIILPTGGRAVIQTGMEDGFQWQVKDGTTWVDIQGETASSLVLTDAKLATIFALTGIAELRYYDTATATVKASASVTSQKIANVNPVLVAEETVAQTLAVVERADDNKVTITINYWLGSEPIYDTWTSDYFITDAINQSVPHPTVQGYLPYIGADNTTETSTAVDLLYAANTLTEDLVIDVYYRPTDVNFTVKHYWQNENDDGYTLHKTEVKTGLTGSHYSNPETETLELAKTYEGFFALLYTEEEFIGADGQTVVEVYYDRYYYLMTFDLGGGYGVDPIYARYGVAIDTDFDSRDPKVPARAGYTFTGWVDEDGTTYANSASLPDVMPAENKKYTAQWSGQTVNYTIVYWRENADDYKYSYWTQTTATATAGDLVSGSDSVASLVSDEQYFTYNDTLTDKNVEVAGDGSTVVNVYYRRNVYTLTFYYDHERADAADSNCNITEHTHGDGKCNSVLICTRPTHTHDDSCPRTQICGLTEHAAHTDACIGCGQTEHTAHTDACISCGQVEHLVHTDDCLVCTVEEHAHGSDCCTIEEHTHGIECIWNGCGGNQTVHTHGDGNCSCSKTEHQHSESCYRNDLHTHSDSCYGDTLHTHSSSCYKDVIHVHSDACYNYTCNATEHVHDAEDCYSYCTVPVHSHSNRNCQYGGSNQNEDGEDGYRIYKVIVAKYEQNIGNQWPTASEIDDFAYWTSSTLSSNQSSKIMTMIPRICVSGGAKFLAHYNTTKYQLNYWFEDFDQTSTTTSATRVRWRDGDNGTYKYYVLSEYTQVSYYGNTSTWGYKDITGMTPAESDEDAERTTVDGVYTFNLYYDRLRYDLYFYNVTGNVTSLTKSDVMYGMPIKNVITVGEDGKPTGDYWLQADDYPVEDGKIYEFMGWYTTPECYDGTEYDFTNGTMPNSDLTLYAKWLPISVTVQFYLTAEDMTAGNELVDLKKTIRQGEMIGEVEDPSRDPLAYTFVGWFYVEEDENGDPVEKAIDFENMAIMKDLKVYAKWSSNALMQYEVRYGIKQDGVWTYIASPTTGSALAGHNKTFEPKTGTALYPNYQEGYFPLIQEHTMTLDIEGTAENEKNVYTFEYIKVDHVPYKVYYVTEEKPADELNKGEVELDGKTYYMLAETKNVTDNKKAAVTERSVTVPGYLPTPFQQSKVLVANGTDSNGDGVFEENVIIFVYEKNENAAYYTVTHYIEDPLGEYIVEIDDVYTHWSIYKQDGLLGEYNQNYTADYITIANYTKDETVPDTLRSGVLSKDTTLDLKLFYRENSVTLNYEVVAPDGVQPADVGTVTINDNDDTTVPGINVSESVKILTGEAKGAEAEAKDNTYKFVGWYDNEACTGTPLSTDPSFTPEQPDDGKWVDGTTYYAKFEYNLTDLTITKDVTDSDPGNEVSFLFEVTDSAGALVARFVLQDGESVTVTGLTVGTTYTIKEDETWSVRYNAASATQTITLSADKTKNVVTVQNSLDSTNDKWLDTETKIENQIPKQSAQ